MKRVIVVSALTCVALLTIARCRPPEHQDTPPPTSVLAIDLKGTPAGTPLAAYDLCVRDERPADRTASVQIFLDASGSMHGFSIPGVMSPLAQWVKRSSIGAPTSGVEFSLARIQAFSAEGLVDLPTQEDTINYTVTHGDTNLDEIVGHANDESVTVIVTDGVPYTSAGKSSSCAGQVDVTCVAKRLRQFIDANAHPGMWIMPLFGRYDGKFSGEGQQIPNDREWADKTARRLKETLGGDIRLRTNDAEDRALNPFFYTGPRTLLVIVLAKDASMGRIFLSSLYERANLYRVALLGENFTAFSEATDKALGAFTPVELYPGYIPRVSTIRGQQRKRQATDVPEDAGGFIAIKRMQDGNPFRAEVACAAARESTPDEIIDLTFSTGTGDNGCHRLFSLPSVQYLPELPSKIAETERQDGAAIVRSLTLSQAGADQQGAMRGEMRIRCSGSGGRPCDQPTTIRVVAKVAYSDAAERLSDRKAPVGAVAYLQKLSTDSLIDEPFKVLALDRMLIEVMRTITQDASARDVATLNVCRTDPPPRPATATTGTQ